MKLYWMRGVARLLIPMLVLLNCSPWVHAADNPPLSDTKILHQPIDSTPSNVPLTISATVEDSAGVDVVRVYFKSTVGTIYYYTPMTQTKGNTYRGRIPAPSADAGEVQYLILVKNMKNVVVKSQQFQTAVSEKPGKQEGKQETIKVYSESPYASKNIIGFAGGYDFQVAEPSEKYGVVAGLYNPESVSWIATDAVAGSTAPEPAEKSWNPYLIGGGVLAGIALVAVALGGGGGGGGSNDSTTTTTPTTTTPTTTTPTTTTPTTTTPTTTTPTTTTPTTTTPTTTTPSNTASGTWKLTSYQYTSACTSPGSGQTQTVTCNSSGNFETVSPSSLTVSVPDTATAGTCVNGKTSGLAEVFLSGQTCDAVKACDNFSPSNLTTKSCQASSIRLERDSGKQIQVWEKQ